MTCPLSSARCRRNLRRRCHRGALLVAALSAGGGGWACCSGGRGAGQCPLLSTPCAAPASRTFKRGAPAAPAAGLQDVHLRLTGRRDTTKCSHCVTAIKKEQELPTGDCPRQAMSLTRLSAALTKVVHHNTPLPGSTVHFGAQECFRPRCPPREVVQRGGEGKEGPNYTKIAADNFSNPNCC